MAWFPELKERSFNSGRTIKCDTRPSGFSNWVTSTTPRITGKESILSQCHTGYWKGADTVGDVGGPMTLERHRTDKYQTARSIDTGASASLIEGELFFGSFSTITTAFPPSSQGHDDVALKAFGARAVAITAPTNPSFSLATALGELKKDGLPKFPELLKERTDLARRGGSDYLNLEFGILPLIRDVRDFAHAVKNSRRILDQYIRDSGRRVRRRYAGLPIVDTSVQSGGGFVGPTSANWPANGTLSESRETSYWFSGAFVYHIPAADSFIGEFRRMESLANHLLGTRLTPDVIWNLAPWSWATDWFTNVGEVMTNISQLGQDGLVLHHGYAMRQQTVTSHYVQTTIPQSAVSRSKALTVKTVVQSEYKRRVRANPYGFSIDFDGLSTRQLAILAALGLSQGKRDGNRHPEPLGLRL